jgi:hypothetical protein
VRLARDMPLEREAELGTGQIANPAVHFDFDSAYWVRGLQPVDMRAGHATIDARSLAIPEAPHTTAPEAFGPATPTQASPFVMTEQAWTTSGSAGATSNGFEASLAGASSVTLELPRMRVSIGAPIRGKIHSDHVLTLGLSGGWTRKPAVSGSRGVPTVSRRGVLSLSLPAGDTTVDIVPAPPRRRAKRR